MDPHVTVSQTGVSLLNVCLKVLLNYHKLDVHKYYIYRNGPIASLS